MHIQRLLRHILPVFFTVSIFLGSAFACTSDQIDVAGDGTNCQTTKFSVTTTNDTSNFIFRMSAKGTFYVDWGDGNVQTIERTNTTITDYSHTYASTGEYTIKFGGTATEYSSASNTADISFYKSSGGTQSKIASISGSLSALFPQTGNNNDNYKFYQTFMGCTNLTEIPDGLFSGITTGANYMFSSTFYGCTSLTEIPADLFSNITTGANYMFYSTFYGCANLTGYIPPTTFAGLIANDSPTETNMWLNTFSNTALATSCPSDTTEFDTRYKSAWGGRVSCEILCDGVMYNGTCHTMCSGMSTLHAGEYTYPVFADKTNVPSPVLHIRQNDTICYVYFEPDNNSAEHGLKVRYNGDVYRAIDPR